MIPLLTKFNNYRQIHINPNDFVHEDCENCTRKFHYKRGCYKDWPKYRCKNVKQEFQEFLDREHLKMENKYKNCDNAIGIMYKSGIVVWVRKE